jgi:hypothetical protein
LGLSLHQTQLSFTNVVPNTPTSVAQVRKKM